MGRKAHNVGLILAILAGVVAVNNAIWPISPHGYAGLPTLATIWLVGSFVIGVAFLVAAYLAEDYTDIAKPILFVGGLILIGSGVYFGALLGIVAATFDILPGLLAVLAGFLIGPVGVSVPTDRGQGGWR